MIGDGLIAGRHQLTWRLCVCVCVDRTAADGYLYDDAYVSKSDMTMPVICVCSWRATCAFGWMLCSDHRRKTRSDRTKCVANSNWRSPSERRRCGAASTMRVGSRACRVAVARTRERDESERDSPAGGGELRETSSLVVGRVSVGELDIFGWALGWAIVAINITACVVIHAFHQVHHLHEQLSDNLTLRCATRSPGTYSNFNFKYILLHSRKNGADTCIPLFYSGWTKL